MSPLIFAIVVDAVTEQASKGLLNEILYANDLVLMSENLEDLRERFQRWRGALESKGMKVFFVCYLVAYSSSNHEKAINALYELA